MFLAVPCAEIMVLIAMISHYPACAAPMTTIGVTVPAGLHAVVRERRVFPLSAAFMVAVSLQASRIIMHAPTFVAVCTLERTHWAHPTAAHMFTLARSLAILMISFASFKHRLCLVLRGPWGRLPRPESSVHRCI